LHHRNLAVLVITIAIEKTQITNAIAEADPISKCFITVTQLPYYERSSAHEVCTKMNSMDSKQTSK